MKVAKNMDSVFANCTQDELDFDAIFSDDDTIIDFIAGVDEAGELLTGPNFDFSKILEEADMLDDQDDAESRDGKVDHKPAAPEGSKEVDLEVGGEVGDGKEVSGKEKSKESEAHDMAKLGSETAQQTAMQKAMEISAKKFADKKECNCCKENAEYEGYDQLLEAVVNGFMNEDEIMSENAADIAIATANYLIDECADAEARDGKVDQDNKGNTEGVKSEVIDKQNKGAASGDPIADDDDQDARDGKIAADKNVEGVANRIIGAALEASGDLDKDIESNTLDAGIESMDREIVPDSVRVNDDANKIDIKQEAASNVEDAYKGLIGGMKDGLQKLALAKALDESVMETAAAIYEAAEGVEESYEEYKEYQDVLEAVIANMTEDQLNVDNVAEYAIEATNFVISEGGKSGHQNRQQMQANFAAMSNKNKKAKVDELHAKAVEAKDPEKASKIKSAVDWAKKHPGKAAGIAAGTAAAAGGAIYAAKKIADKKKAAAKEKEEVKENYEYPEYAELVEAVVAGLTEEELMSENASEFACEVADYMIESFDTDEIMADDDDEDIESIASNDDPKVNLTYDYDDDELIDMVAGDDQL